MQSRFLIYSVPDELPARTARQLRIVSPGDGHALAASRQAEDVRVARASLFVQSTRGSGGFRVAPRFRVAGRRGDPRGWRGRRRRGATPSGVEPRWRRPRQTRVRDSAPSRAFARKRQNRTPQLPLISVPRSGFQKIGISLLHVLHGSETSGDPVARIARCWKFALFREAVRHRFPSAPLALTQSA